MLFTTRWLWVKTFFMYLLTYMQSFIQPNKKDKSLLTTKCQNSDTYQCVTWNHGRTTVLSFPSLPYDLHLYFNLCLSYLQKTLSLLFSSNLIDKETLWLLYYHLIRVQLHPCLHNVEPTNYNLWGLPKLNWKKIFEYICIHIYYFNKKN